MLLVLYPPGDHLPHHTAEQHGNKAQHERANRIACRQRVLATLPQLTVSLPNELIVVKPPRTPVIRNSES